MPRFFVDKTAFFDTVDTGAEKAANVTEKFARIVGDDAFHIARSLRMAVGEHVTICDTESTDYECELEKITDFSFWDNGRSVIIYAGSQAVFDCSYDIFYGLKRLTTCYNKSGLFYEFDN